MIISQKMSNSGSIYDIASEHYDRAIKNASYTVILPSYYGDHSTRHRTERGAIKSHDQLVKMGYQGVQILDRDGDRLEVVRGYWDDRLALA